MPNRISNSSAVSTRQVRFDAGPALLNATSQINGGTDNPTIDRLAADISSALQRNGVRDTRWVGEMLYQMRGARQGVGGDAQRFAANVNKAAKLGVLGPNGRAQLLARVGAADNQARVDNSILNVKNQQPQQRDRFDVTPELLKNRPQYQPIDLFKTSGSKTNQAQRTAQVKKADVPTPKLDATIDGLDKATKAMPDGAIKQSLLTVKSSLELARTAEKKGDTVAYTKAIGGLSQNMLKTVGEVVKSFGQDETLAKAAADQLGKIAGYVGKGVKVVGAIDDLSKVLRGTSLSGEAVSQGKRVDAAINLVTTFLPGPIGTGVSVAKAQLEWCFNNIGVPAKQAFTEFGLRGLFGGKSVEDMRESIRKVAPITPNTARWAINKLQYETFKNTSALNNDATASSLWATYWKRELKGDETLMNEVFSRAKVPPGSDEILDLKRVQLAEKFQRAAMNFIDEQVRDAKGSWGV